MTVPSQRTGPTEGKPPRTILTQTSLAAYYMITNPKRTIPLLPPVSHRHPMTTQDRAKYNLSLRIASYCHETLRAHALEVAASLRERAAKLLDYDYLFWDLWNSGTVVGMRSVLIHAGMESLLGELQVGAEFRVAMDAVQQLKDLEIKRMMDLQAEQKRVEEQVKRLEELYPEPDA